MRFTLSLILFISTAELCFGIDKDSPWVTIFGGSGATVQDAVSGRSFQYGVSMGGYEPNKFFGFSMEFGYASPFYSKNPDSSSFRGAAILSPFNYIVAFNTLKSDKLPASLSSLRMPIFFTAGYTRLIRTGNSVNYGAGMDFRISATRAIRFEIRDYWKLTGTGDREHNVAFRLGCVFFVED